MGKMTVYHGSYTIMTGREDPKENDLFFTCSLIEYIARKTKNMDIIEALITAYNSFVSDKIQDFNSSFYYDAPQNILNTWLYGKIE